MKFPMKAAILSEATRFALRIGKMSVLKLRTPCFASKKFPLPGEGEKIEILFDDKLAACTRNDNNKKRML